MGRYHALTRDERREVYRRYHDEGETISGLARRYHVDRQTIRRTLKEFDEADKEATDETGRDDTL